MKKVLIITVSVLVALAGSAALFVYTTMWPMKTAQIEDDFWGITEGFVTLFIVKGGSGYIAFDTGMATDAVESRLGAFGIDPIQVNFVFLTHSDTDHSGGISLFPNATVYLPELEEPMVLGQDSRYFFGRPASGRNKALISRGYRLLPVNEKIEVDGVQIQSVSVPGHSPGSTAYIVNNRYAIVGDMAVVAGKKLKPLPSFINNDQNLAKETVAAFWDEYSDLDVIATAHDGILRLKGK